MNYLKKCYSLHFLLFHVVMGIALSGCNLQKTALQKNAETQNNEFFDLLIVNGRIVDGMGNPWYRADIGIINDKIVAIGNLKNRKATSKIDAKDNIVAPGFIDVHSHAEIGIFKFPTADNYLQGGVTSIVTGNCGSSMTDIGAFFQQLDSMGISVNLGSLIGHGSVRSEILRSENRPPSEDEQQKMNALVEQAMKDGALGLSTGLIYVPASYARTEEVVSLAEIAGNYNGIYASHMRNEGLKIHEAIAEALIIGKQANIPLHISHFKILAKPLWGQTVKTVNAVEEARKNGQDVTIDQYPYTASSTTLGVMLQPEAFQGGQKAFQERVDNPSEKEKIIEGMRKILDEDEREDYDFAVVANYEGDSTFNGRSIKQINTDLGRPSTQRAQMELGIDMLYACGLAGSGMVYHRMTEEDVVRILSYPNTMIAGDAGVEDIGSTAVHPRTYGTNARIFKRYVREQKILTLEDAVRRMTSLPASRFGLNNRGLLLEGKIADIVIFNENEIADKATFKEPHAYSEGISHVIVNGKLTVENQVHKGVRNGTILKHRQQ